MPLVLLLAQLKPTEPLSRAAILSQPSHNFSSAHMAEPLTQEWLLGGSRAAQVDEGWPNMEIPPSRCVFPPPALLFALLSALFSPRCPIEGNRGL